MAKDSLPVIANPAQALVPLVMNVRRSIQCSPNQSELKSQLIISCTMVLPNVTRSLGSMDVSSIDCVEGEWNARLATDRFEGYGSRGGHPYVDGLDGFRSVG